MKSRRIPLVTIGTTLGVTLLLALVAAKPSDVLSVGLQDSKPTPAPTPTPGAPPAIQWTSSVASQPVLNSDDALAVALRLDAVWCVWDKPWSKDMLVSEPDRITIKLFPTRAAENADASRGNWNFPADDPDAGSVWRITIKGNVKVGVISMDISDANRTYDGVTYIISQKTGHLLGVIAGLPKN